MNVHKCTEWLYLDKPIETCWTMDINFAGVLPIYACSFAVGECSLPRLSGRDEAVSLLNQMVNFTNIWLFCNISDASRDCTRHDTRTNIYAFLHRIPLLPFILNWYKHNQSWRSFLPRTVLEDCRHCSYYTWHRARRKHKDEWRLSLVLACRIHSYLRFLHALIHTWFGLPTI